MYIVLSFLIPLLVRAIPEVLMGEYIVGFDVMAHYLPTTLLWLDGGINLWSFIATAPLFYTLTVGLVLVGSPLLLVLKILPSILLGFLGLSIYGYTKLGLCWSFKKSLLSALVGTLYFVAFRISWDALREVVAIIFVFIALTLLAGRSKNFSWMRLSALSLAIIAVILSNQVVAVLMLGIILFTIINNVVHKNRKDSIFLIISSLPALLLFFVMWYLSPAISEYRLIFGFPNTNDGWLALFGYSSYSAFLGSEALFLLYCFLPLLPLALLSIKRIKNFQLRCWIILILIAAFIPMVSPSIFRLLMLLTYPFAIYAVEGLSKLQSIKWNRYKITFFRIGTLYLILVTAILSLGFMMPPENPFPYYKSDQWNAFVYQIPTSMLQNTVSKEDCPDVSNAISWFKENRPDDSILLSHRAYYGWALTALDKDQVKLYEYDDPAETAHETLNAGFNKIYLIWWIDGRGWYGLPNVPSEFHEQYRSGNIAIYSYIS